MRFDINLKDLETERISFRKLEKEDGRLMLEFFTSEKAMEFLPFSKRGEEGWKELFERQKARYETFGAGLWCLINKQSSEILGMCGLLVQTIDDQQVLEIGYHLLPSQWKKGYATEAARSCKDYLFKNSLSDSICSIIHVNNINSQNVAIRNGMEKIKQTTFYTLPVFLYQISIDDWKKEGSK